MSADAIARNANDSDWGDGPNPFTCDDRVWSEATGMCGGCGGYCHGEKPCEQTIVRSFWDGRPKSVCTLCPARIAEGWFVA